MQQINRCPIESALDYLRSKWTFEIVRDLFMGAKRFKGFLKKNPHLSSKVLSDRLKELCENGIVNKKIVQEFPVTIEYSLTEKGKKLNKVLYELAVFACDCGVEDGKFNQSCSISALNQLKKIFKIS
jgi:DNA-binding HxlR family transcriptional regulator